MSKAHILTRGRCLSALAALLAVILLASCGGETVSETAPQADSVSAIAEVIPVAAPTATTKPAATPKPSPTPTPTPAPKAYNFDTVVHAAGAIGGYAGTNSVEAVEASISRGARLIEIDILRTTDGEYVCAHDWEYMQNRVAFAANAPVSSETFSDYRIFNRFTPLTVDKLAEILTENPGVSVVTDTKDRDYTSLSHIALRYPKLMAQIIPQVYKFDDFAAVKAMGYKNIIVTLYAMTPKEKSDPEAVAARAKALSVYALTIPDELAAISGYTDALRARGVRFFVHTVNDVKRAAELYAAGAAGVYSDYLYMDADAPAGIKSLSKAAAPVEKFAFGDTEYIPLGNLIRRYGATEYKYLAAEHGVSFTFGDGKYRLISGSVAVERTRGGVTKDVYPGGVMTAFNDAFYVSAEIATEIFGGI
jgi:glycerophosphoryl diester phosphodiesterase